MVKEVKCIDNASFLRSLSKGTIYNVIREDLEHYLILDNESKKCSYYKHRFKVVFEEKIYEVW